ncbi:hypothetical protein GCM10022239_09850 [Leifsonia bigeumensis]|uniref:Uncharacterized protein n=1 Tax=Leifsonella bigeumensis TaxID=433643 RepID=A0ABP7FHC7_9MICO
MRWNNLFDDLEGQLEHELGAEEVDLRGEEERLRLGRLSMRDRLQSLHEACGAREYSLRIALRDGAIIRLRPLGFGKDWMSADLLDETTRRAQVIVPLESVASIILDRDQVAASLAARPGDGSRGLSARLGIAFVLRDLCRRRSPVDLMLVGGTLHGTIDRVGREHCDVAVHEPGTSRRESGVTQYRVVPFGQLLLVRM